MSEKSTTSTGGVSFLGLLTIVFITLKLLGHITWSWWWVLSPLWMPLAFLLSCVLIFWLLLALSKLFGYLARKSRNRASKR